MKWPLALVLALGGCVGEAAPPSPADRPTIVSLNPCADAILAELAAPGQLLAISHYSRDPASSSMEPGLAEGFASTGGTAEEVIALAPQMVVADPFLSPATRGALEDAGIRVEALGIAADLEASLAQVRRLAALAGEEERGRELAARIASAWAEAGFAGADVETLLWQEGGIVPGEATLAAAMLDHTGFSLHSAARGLGQGAYLPLEQVLADPPELVLAAGDERMLTHPVLQGREGIAYRRFDPALLYCGGPTIPRALERLQAIREDIG